jgi:uncharacterized protein YndB with AHSA1/START domain
VDELYVQIVERTPAVVAETRIAAPAATVWDLISDIQLPARFSDEFVGAEWVDPPGLGARFVGRNDRGDIGGWKTVCTVTAWSPGEAFEWTVGDVEAPTAIWRHDIVENPHGSRLTMTARLGAGRSFLRAVVRRYPEQAEPLVTRRMEEWGTNMRSTVEGIRSMIESG